MTADDAREAARKQSVATPEGLLEVYDKVARRYAKMEKMEKRRAEQERERERQRELRTRGIRPS